MTREETRALTEWLTLDVSIRLREYCIRKGISSLDAYPKCPVCGAYTLKWDPTKEEPRIFCSMQCRRSDKGSSMWVEKVKGVMQDRYGVSNSMELESSRTKKITTLLDKYEVDNPMRNPSTVQKAQETNLKKYGVPSPCQNEEVKLKSMATSKKRYGGVHHLQNKEVIKKREDTCIQKYGVRNVFASEEIKEKIATTNTRLYGAECVLSIPEVRDRINKTNRLNHYRKLIIELKLKGIVMISSKTEYASGDEFDFSCTRCTTKFKSSGTEIQHITCPNPEHRFRSSYEYEMKGYLDALGVSPVCNNVRFYEGGKYVYELDIYLPEQEIGIELNGVYWHSDIYLSREYHQKKYLYFKDKGIELIQIFETEWLTKRDIVLSIISNRLGFSTSRVYARKCKVQEITPRIYRDFLSNNHMQGPFNSKVKLGLFHGEDLVAIQSFSGRRYYDKGEGEYELVRFCTSKTTAVIGGFSKLLTYFIKNYSPKLIDSYVDVRYFNSHGYSSNGFSEIKLTSPDYFYFKKGNDSLQHRSNFNKKILGSKLEIFDPILSERENMGNNGYLRIFDAGNLLMRRVLS